MAKQVRLSVNDRERYNSLTVIDNYVAHSLEGRGKLALCACDCGNDVCIDLHSLIKGVKRSCGCLRTYNKRSEAAIGKIHAQYKQSAKAKNLAFELTANDIKFLTSQNCFYCEQPPSNQIKIKLGNYVHKYSGIDRLENKLGYISGNVVPCCRPCNFSKHEQDYTLFVERCRRIVKNLYRKSDQ